MLSLLRAKETAISDRITKGARQPRLQEAFTLPARRWVNLVVLRLITASLLFDIHTDTMTKGDRGWWLRDRIKKESSLSGKMK